MKYTCLCTCMADPRSNQIILYVFDILISHSTEIELFIIADWYVFLSHYKKYKDFFVKKMDLKILK